jgi:aspartate-semialdehyde dehydrogenase
MVGYPGVASLDILDNVVPYIGGEEEKMEWETSKILGGVDASSDTGFTMPRIPVPP